MKQLITFLICLIASLNLSSQNLEDLSFGTDSTLDIVTWNIEWFPKNGQSTIQYVSDIINAMEADVIALQEIDEYTEFVDMVEELEGWEGISTNTGYLNLAYIYNPEFVTMNSILQILPDKSRELPRKPIVLEIMFQGQEYILINNHLKCCGDGAMNLSDPWDEETRRYDACVLLDAYIEENFADKNVIVLGDLNDLLTDSESNNVFQVFFDDPSNYLFTDMAIAEGPSADWSYPSWPSHLDHILISNELFDDFENSESEILTIRIDDYLEGGFWEYESNVSDHRPVGLKLMPNEGSASIGERGSVSNLIISPNPMSTQAYVNFDPVPADSWLGIYNGSGSLVKRIDLNAGQTKASIQNDWAADGIYHVNLFNGQQSSAAQKLIVIR